MDSFHHLDAMSQAKLVKDKEVKPIELIEAVSKRIEHINPTINAVVTKMFDEARTIALENKRSGPFAGVPFLMKDLEFFGGSRYTGGSRFLKDFVAPVDSALSSRIRKTGLITVGKTNTCEFGIQPITEPALFGPTRNPWNLDYTVGGSSGGAAAAVASGIVPMAHASDGGGSIRIPASCCGIFGLKISKWRNPKHPDPVGIAVNHCVSRSVRDSAALLDATHGNILGTPYSPVSSTGTFVGQVNKEPGKLRIGFVTTAFDGNSIHPDCASAVLDAANLCEQLGHEVEESKPDINVQAFTSAFTTIWYSLLALGVESLPNLVGRSPESGDFEPLTWGILQQAKHIKSVEYLTAVSFMQQLTRVMEKFFINYDLLLTPTLSKPPVKIGEITYTGDLNQYSKFINEWVPYTPIANATGIPAMSVPLFWNSNGLPIGVHFMAPYGDEATLFRLAGQLEQARPWAEKLPPFH